MYTNVRGQWRIKDFPVMGARTLRGVGGGGEGHQHTILQTFPENCMKSKEFGRPVGLAPPWIRQ